MNSMIKRIDLIPCGSRNKAQEFEIWIKPDNQERISDWMEQFDHNPNIDMALFVDYRTDFLARDDDPIEIAEYANTELPAPCCLFLWAKYGKEILTDVFAILNTTLELA